MAKNLLLLVLSILSIPASAQSIKSATVTVDELLVIDSAQALAKAQEEAQKTGFLNPKTSASSTAVAPPPKWSVKSIYGSGSVIAADIVVDGVVTFDAKPGTVIGSCRVAAINNTCVVVLPALAKRGVKSTCPKSACWTGDEMAAETSPSQALPAGNQSGGGKTSPLPPAPMPLPMATTTTQR